MNKLKDLFEKETRVSNFFIFIKSIYNATFMGREGYYQNYQMII